MTFAQRRNRLTTHFLERIPVVKRHMTVFGGKSILFVATALLLCALLHTVILFTKFMRKLPFSVSLELLLMRVSDIKLYKNRVMIV